jgi:hypothetical protein
MTILEQLYFEKVPYHAKNITQELNMQNKIAALSLALCAGIISKDTLVNELKPILEKLNIKLSW